MVKKGRGQGGPRRPRGGGGAPGGGGGRPAGEGGRRPGPGGRGAPPGRGKGRPGAKAGGPRGASRGKKRAPKKSGYFMQPGRRGVVIVLRHPIGNRATPKICGVMPTRVHAKMLVDQLEKAESVVKDLFMEATDDGIEALEAILAACREEVIRLGPPVRLVGPDEEASAEADQQATNAAGGEAALDPDASPLE